MYDVYLFGMISASTVFILDKDFLFPKPNEYAEIHKELPSVGGEAINTAIVLSKLGITTKMDGNWLGKKNSTKIFSLLKSYNIDLSQLSVKDGYNGTEEVVIVDQNTRTVFGNYITFHAGDRQWNYPKESDIQNAKIISIDPYFKQESLSVAHMCIKHHKPYVSIDCRYEDFIAQHAEAIIISHELRNQSYPNIDPENLFKKYQNNCKGLIIFTFGENDLWYSRGNDEKKYFSPYKIIPIDTTGAGDSFRSGIIYGLLNSWKDRDIIDFACAVSACVCLSIPHTLNSPNLDGVTKFMEENSNNH
ncbi:MAG: carbohydrate kinase family protein [Candidatus Lokiarchaeota archaeon]|nr:carbohydrate kinase family protein [Candidatus Lokiarchaeota archaeon]